MVACIEARHVLLDAVLSLRPALGLLLCSLSKAKAVCIRQERVVFVAGRGESDGWLQPRIVLLDAGMVTRMSGADQHNMLQLFRAFTQKDGQGVANAILQFSGALPACLPACLSACLPACLTMCLSVLAQAPHFQSLASVFLCMQVNSRHVCSQLLLPRPCSITLPRCRQLAPPGQRATSAAPQTPSQLCWTWSANTRYTAPNIAHLSCAYANQGLTT